MKILFCGDVVGRSGRDVLQKHIPTLKTSLELDLVIVNGENTAHGFGITEKFCKEFYDIGVDVITTGNHVWDQRETIEYINKDSRLLRPLNFHRSAPGKGCVKLTSSKGEKILVINLMGRLFMEAHENPFQAIDDLLSKELEKNLTIFVDFHAEATSEKQSMAYFLDGKVAAVIGTHTHVPTSDHRILPKGTAYQSDVGMCGDYDSILGMEKDVPISRFLRQLPTKDKMKPSQGEATLCAVLIETENGLSKKITPIRVDGALSKNL